MTSFHFNRIALLILTVAMMVVSSYLSYHYYAVHFPSETVLRSAMCQISDFWNCDTVSFSPLASIGGIPTAIFGLFLGAIFFFSEAVRRTDLSRTNHFLAWVNAALCVGLFGYSILALNGLCPGCFVYYLCSFAVLGLYQWRAEQRPIPSPKILLAYGLLLLVCGLSLRTLTHEMAENDQKFITRLLKEIDESPNYDEANTHSGFLLAGKTGPEKAKLRIGIVSDFLCPVCAVFSQEMLPLIIKHYEPNISVEYFFYPLDGTCHPRINGQRHPLACEAAYLAYCAKPNFAKVHDEIYAQSLGLSREWIEGKAASMNLSQCLYEETTKDEVVKIIETTDRLDIKGTPTLLVNGKILNGILPVKYLFVIFDSLIAKEK